MAESEEQSSGNPRPHQCLHSSHETHAGPNRYGYDPDLWPPRS
ncbi:MAG: hypothetical protein U1D68_11115 [Arthrobacter sp.]|nr:hypothetical protein [Arthrobacter sp.]MDZ4354022.1 hypothetical protein [Arthrobacter sp.]